MFSVELYDDYAETSALAESVSDTGGVYFIPSFQGLQVRKYFSNSHNVKTKNSLLLFFN